MDDLEKTAWKLFEKTGRTGYYLLYKKLRESSEREEKK